LCDMRCYSYWSRRDFGKAKAWGREGLDLKSVGNVDTKYDCEHNLALAQRDSGEVDPALKVFLNGEDLSKVIDPEIIEANRGGTFYGNIGRCLWLKGETQSALECLRKSAILLEDEHGVELLQNQGWAAFWIGEVLEVLGRPDLAWICYKRAEFKWKDVSPPKADQASAAADLIVSKVGEPTIGQNEREIDRKYLDWLKNQ